MAKKSIVIREVKRKKLADKYFKKRTELRDAVKNMALSEDERYEASVQLQKLPRDSAPTRGRNRCNLTGRPHGYYRKFGLGRNKLRESVMRGDVPGVVKASW